MKERTRTALDVIRTRYEARMLEVQKTAYKYTKYLRRQAEEDATGHLRAAASAAQVREVADDGSIYMFSCWFLFVCVDSAEAVLLGRRRAADD